MDPIETQTVPEGAATPEDILKTVQPEATPADAVVESTPTPLSAHKLSGYAAELQAAAKQLAAMVQDSNLRSENHQLAAVSNHLIEAGQWLGKAVIVLQKAGV